MHKVFISYHHENDQIYKDQLLYLNNLHQIFIDGSVNTEDISDDLKDEAIRQKIRDEYLRDTTVTIALVGTETKGRKHVDWEVYSSMIDGAVNKKSGILAISLPTTGCNNILVSHTDEKKIVYPEYSEWVPINGRAEYESRHPNMPNRIIDNLANPEAKVSVTLWDKIINDPNNLAFLIEATFADRGNCIYDMSRPMRRANS